MWFCACPDLGWMFCGQVYAWKVCRNLVSLYSLYSCCGSWRSHSKWACPIWTQYLAGRGLKEETIATFEGKFYRILFLAHQYHVLTITWSDLLYYKDRLDQQLNSFFVLILIDAETNGELFLTLTRVEIGDVFKNLIDKRAAISSRKEITGLVCIKKLIVWSILKICPLLDRFETLKDRSL